MSKQKIQLQKVPIRRDQLHTLNDFQKLLVDINWLEPTIVLSVQELTNLFQILQGDSRQLTAAAKEELVQVKQKLQNVYVDRVDLTKRCSLAILPLNQPLWNSLCRERIIFGMDFISSQTE